MTADKRAEAAEVEALARSLDPKGWHYGNGPQREHLLGAARAEGAQAVLAAVEAVDVRGCGCDCEPIIWTAARVTARAAAEQARP